MQSAIFKFVALAGVIGVGCFVVLEVHRRLPTPQAETADANQFQRADDSDDPAESSNSPPQNSDLPPEQSFEPLDDTPHGAGTERRVAVRDELPISSPSDFPAADDDVFNPGPPGQMEPPTLVDADSEWEDVPSQPAEPIDVESDNPFASGDLEPAAEPVADVSDAPVLPGAEQEGATSQPFALERSEAEMIQPVAAEDPTEEVDSFDPFSGEEIAAASVESTEDPPARAADAAPVMDLFGPVTDDSEGAAAEDDAMVGLAEPREPVEPLLFPAEANEAGFVETTPPPKEPVVAPSPFDGVMLVDEEEAQELELLPVEEAEADAPFDPFGDSDSEMPANEADAEFGDAAEEPAPLLLEFPGPDDADQPEPVLPFGEEPEELSEPAPVLSDSEPQPAPEFIEIEDSGDEMPVIRGNSEASAFDFSRDAEAEELPDVRPLPANASTPAPEFDAGRPGYVGDGTLSDRAPRGPQQPELTIEKVAPQEANVGEPLIYAINLRNAGNSTAHDVIIEDRIPRGTELDGTIPQAELIDGRLVWRLGEMEPGQEEVIRIRVVPTEAGEIGSVATVRFVAEVAAKTVVTSPKLSLAIQGPSEVAVGERAVFRFVVSNTGQAEARNVYIENLLPAALEHPGGDAIECEIGTLAGGESREVELAVTAVAAGSVTTQASAYVGQAEFAQTEANVAILDSRLTIERQGPSRRFVGRSADYSTVVTNRAKSTLRQVRVVEQLPDGLELAGIPKGGKFDPIKRTIVWTIEELPAGESRRLQTSVVARTAGSLQSVVRASDADGNGAELRSKLEVAGFESLALDLEHDGRPVLVGEQVALRMTVKNRGTGPAHEVRTAFEIPDNLEFVEARGPVEYRHQGRTIEFAAINELAADEEQSFDIVLTAARTGPTRVTAQLETPKLGAPLRHDEAVIIQADEP
mgnify:FL=1